MPLPTWSVVFQFDCRHLHSAKKARTCMYVCISVGLKREKLPSLLSCWSLFLFGLRLSSFPTVRLLFTIMWKTLQSLVQFLEDLSLLLVPVTTVPFVQWLWVSAQGVWVKQRDLTPGGLLNGSSVGLLARGWWWDGCSRCSWGPWSKQSLNTYLWAINIASSSMCSWQLVLVCRSCQW